MRSAYLYAFIGWGNAVIGGYFIGRDRWFLGLAYAVIALVWHGAAFWRVRVDGSI